MLEARVAETELGVVRQLDALEVKDPGTLGNGGRRPQSLLRGIGAVHFRSRRADQAHLPGVTPGTVFQPRAIRGMADCRRDESKATVANV